VHATPEMTAIKTTGIGRSPIPGKLRCATQMASTEKRAGLYSQAASITDSMS
jgi:hypothetical protein